MTEHLTSQQIERYHKHALDPAELIWLDEHLTVCAECSLQLKAATLSTEYAPPAEVIPPATRQSLPHRLSANLSSLFAFNSPAVAFGMGALAMLVVVGFVWLIVRANRTGTTQPQVVQTSSPTPAASPENGAMAGASPSPTPSPSPQVLLALNDGAKQVGIDERGNLVGLDDLPPATRDAIRTALITEQAANLAALSGVGGQQGVLTGGKNEGTGFAPLSPVGKVLFGPRPTLRWSKLDGASDYRVEIYDSNSSLVESSPPLTLTFWDLPHELGRGEVYSWLVTATKDGAKVKTPVAPAPEAKFKILDQKHAADVTVARKIYAGSHLALGVLYAQAGLLDEAEREFVALSRANPQSEAARKLLNNVRAAKSAAMK